MAVPTENAMSAALASAGKLSIVVVLVAACGVVSDERGARVVFPLGASSAQAEGTADVFHGVGVVTAVDSAKGWLTVDHDEIKGFMCAMEMMYRVEPPRLTANVRVGDRVAFDIDAARETIVGVRVVKAATP
jgi:Cu/Ag efflux protein CusF